MQLTRQTSAPDAAQMQLLLEADPDAGKIAAYLESGALYVAEAAGHAVGLVVLVPLAARGADVWEIKNIVLAPAARGRGHGKALLAAACDVLVGQGAKAVEIGTGNSSLDQLALYQKAGFRIVDVWPDFFADYPEPIVENGIECRDMVRLRLAL